MFSSSCLKLRNSYYWKEWKNKLYEKEWCPYIKKTFNGFGNAIEYLSRYTHKIDISNSRLLNITETAVTFSALGRNPVDYKRRITLTRTEFIRRYLMNVLTSGFQKYVSMAFLTTGWSRRNWKLYLIISYFPHVFFNSSTLTFFIICLFQVIHHILCIITSQTNLDCSIQQYIVFLLLLICFGKTILETDILGLGAF